MTQPKQPSLSGKFAAIWRELRLDFKQFKVKRRIRKRHLKYVRRAEAFGCCHPEIPYHLQSSDWSPIRFVHSGNAGDIIYSLPALKVLSRGRPAQYLIELDTPAFYADGVHPLGRVRMNESTARNLIPLLEAQDYIDRATILDADDGSVDCRLDVFRDAPLPGDRGHIVRWYFSVFGISADLSQPWLRAAPAAATAGYILVARSQRYRNPALDYAVLGSFSKVAFVGTQAEYEDLRKTVPQLEYRIVPHFLAMAEAIAGCRFFIGNQSLPFAIAEGLKVPRILEISPEVPNVVPEGEDAFDAWFQPQFEFLVRQLDQRTAI